MLYPRPTRNPDQAFPISPSTYRATALGRWLESIDVRDEYDHRVHLTPHHLRMGGEKLIEGRPVQHEAGRVHVGPASRTAS